MQQRQAHVQVDCLKRGIYPPLHTFTLPPGSPLSSGASLRIVIVAPNLTEGL